MRMRAMFHEYPIAQMYEDPEHRATSEIQIRGRQNEPGLRVLYGPATEMAARGRGRNIASTELNATEILTAINTIVAANIPEEEGEGGNGRPMILATFLKVKPPEFKGTVNVTEVDDWFQAMERSLQAQHVQAKQYVEFATYMLQGEAQHWWAGVRRIL
ncbi:hypothetical protein PIB30_091819 [Stylosanthes scabra]|uniref:Retrotransposon gag domain-containing protein n=1 Tax=Stylosanthes scabra TaxID=79078 RepID=A0ABU6SW29_9FABA|nr:hypothetical protein [Stylosanthes scabra]